jgi:AcrR family transcriptional regulator
MSQGERPAHQHRSRATRDRIAAALDEALKKKPFDQVTVAEIAERADVAVGTVYRRFENKDALIPVVLEIYKGRLDKWMAGEGAIEVDPKDDLRAVLAKVMRAAWRLIEKEAHLLRAVHLYVRLKPELASDASWKTYETSSYQAIETLFKAYAAQIKRKNVARAAAVAAYLLNVAFLEKGLYPDESPAAGLKYGGRALADEIADMLYAYLQLPEK